MICFLFLPCCLFNVCFIHLCYHRSYVSQVSLLLTVTVRYSERLLIGLGPNNLINLFPLWLHSLTSCCYLLLSVLVNVLTLSSNVSSFVWVISCFGLFILSAKFQVLSDYFWFFLFASFSLMTSVMALKMPSLLLYPVGDSKMFFLAAPFDC